jgi:hypothetical protein
VVTVGLAGASSANASATPTHADPFAVPNPSAQLRTEEILPTDTDPDIDVALEPHYVAFDPSVPRQDRLFLFQTGALFFPSRGPRTTRLITEQAAANGFHAINLRYVNDLVLLDVCPPDGECWEQLHLAAIYGGESDKLVVTRANSIENRLIKLLAFLERKHPGEGWSRYLKEDGLKWSAIIVAGWSQGGGNAALIARDNKVARVIMLEAPVDRNQVTPPADPAPWLSDPHVTPVERYFGLAHIRSPNTVPFFESAWQLLGMDRFGPTVNVDTEGPPFNGTHQLATNVQPAPPGAFFHRSVATDDDTPKDAGGRPILAVAWQYLMRAPQEDDD